MTRRVTILAAVVVLAGAWTGSAQDQQVEISGNPVWENATAGPLNTRAPGQMVTNGIARHNASLNRAFNWPEITATDRDSELVTQLKVSMIQNLFNNLNAVLLFFDNAIRAQAGFAPYVPNPIRPGGSSGIDLGSTDISGLIDQYLGGS